jgi:mitochondrial import receptor subunit TOM20
LVHLISPISGLGRPGEIYIVHLTNNLSLTLDLLAYVIYFDYRRRNDPNFRKALRREHRRQAKAAKEEAEAQGALQREAIKAAMAEAKEEGFPTDAEEKETFFMSEVSRGEQLCQEGKTSRMVQEGLRHVVTKLVEGSNSLFDGERSMPTPRVLIHSFIAGPELAVEAALCFYKALKVYPQPRSLISIYDNTVPKVCS